MNLQQLFSARIVPVFLFFVVFSSSSFADGGVILMDGRGEEETSVVRAAFNWPTDSAWVYQSGWTIRLHGELSYSSWDIDTPVTEFTADGASYNSTLEILPVFRFTHAAITNGIATPYIDAGIGIIGFEQHKMKSGGTQPINLGSHFNFSDFVGFGLIFGDDGRLELGYRLHHYSNAGMSHSNDGTEVQYVGLMYRL